MQTRLKGLYAITDPNLVGQAGRLAQVEQALAGGARMIQFRTKSDDSAQHKQTALDLLQLCRRHNVPLIINDDLELAANIGADGVHLGRDDPDPVDARKLLGSDAIIGLSCYNCFDRAVMAQELALSYAAFGRFFPSASKPKAVQADLELLRRARHQLEIPLVAIGGITPENGAPLIQAGADMLAVIQSIFGQPNIRAACTKFNQLFERKGVFQR